MSLSFQTVQLETESFEQQLRSQSRRLEEQDQELLKLYEQLETERASREKIEAELSELKQNSAPAATVSEKLTPDAATILSQLARQAQKVKNRPGGLGSHFRNFGKLRRQNFTATS